MDADSPVSREEFVNPFGRALCIPAAGFPRDRSGAWRNGERRLKGASISYMASAHIRVKLEGLGYASLADLARHPRFGKSANVVSGRRWRGGTRGPFSRRALAMSS